MSNNTMVNYWQHCQLTHRSTSSVLKFVVLLSHLTVSCEQSWRVTVRCLRCHVSLEKKNQEQRDHFLWASVLSEDYTGPHNHWIHLCRSSISLHFCCSLSRLQFSCCLLWILTLYDLSWSVENMQLEMVSFLLFFMDNCRTSYSICLKGNSFSPFLPFFKCPSWFVFWCTNTTFFYTLFLLMSWQCRPLSTRLAQQHNEKDTK